jgi:hypothetical protein
MFPFRLYQVFVSVVMVVVVVTMSFVRLGLPQLQRTAKVSSHRRIGIGFQRHDSLNAHAFQAPDKTLTRSAAKQNVGSVERMRACAMAFVKSLLQRQFEQGFADDIFLVIDFVNPELPAFAAVSGDGLAVLAGDSDSHFIPRCDRFRDRIPNFVLRAVEHIGQHGHARASIMVAVRYYPHLTVSKARARIGAMLQSPNS